MAVERTYPLEVVAKYDGSHGFGSITLRSPRVDSGELDLHRPWWFDRTHTGAPITVDLAPEEMKEIEIGTLFYVTLRRDHSNG